MIKAIVYGVGSVGRDLVKPMLDKGVNIVGALDANPAVVGRDLGDVAGLAQPLGLVVRDDADALLDEVQADVALVCISTHIETMMPHLERCLNRGINVITATDGLGYPWTMAPKAGNRLDQLARDRGVTLLSSGWQDPYTIQLIHFLAGTCYRIKHIEMTLTSNLDHTGVAELSTLGVGESEEAFRQRQDAAGDEVKAILAGKSAYMEAVTVGMGLTTKSMDFWLEPVLATEATHCKLLDVVIEPGQVLGADMKARIETEEGISYLSVMSLIVFQQGVPDRSPVAVKIQGDPDVHFEGHNIDIHTHVCQALVNRIPDAINAKPGLLTNDQLSKPVYRAKPMHDYLDTTKENGTGG